MSDEPCDASVLAQRHADAVRRAERARAVIDDRGMQDYIDALVTSAPALTPPQRQRLEILLRQPER